MKKHVKVLIISNAVGRGGADRQIINVSKYLAARGYKIKIISLSPLGIMGLEARDKEGLDVASINLLRVRNLFPGLLQLLGLVISWRPQLLVTFMFHATMVGRILKILGLVPCHVSSIRSINMGSSRRETIFRLTNIFDDLTTINSRNAARHLLAKRVIDKAKLKIIPNGIDIKLYQKSPAEKIKLRERMSLPTDRFVWIIVARTVEAKDYPTLLAAYKLVMQRDRRPLLLVVGTGKLLKQVQEMASHYQLDGTITFLGPRYDIPDLLAVADAFVFSSAWEGMPNVIMEALASALPVVATNVGGIPELVIEGMSGFLVPPKNPPALAQAMQKLMQMTPTEKAALGAYGLTYMIENYSLESITAQWECVLVRVLLKREGRR